MPDDIFEEIITKALQEACKVDCDVEDFITGLEWWISPHGPIAEELDAAREFAE